MQDGGSEYDDAGPRHQVARDGIHNVRTPGFELGCCSRLYYPVPGAPFVVSELLTSAASEARTVVAVRRAR